MTMFAAVAGLVLALYVAGHALIRTTQHEVWARDGETYVIFPAEPIALWYLYRRLTVADAQATGMRFHIGPHRE